MRLISCILLLCRRRGRLRQLVYFLIILLTITSLTYFYGKRLLSIIRTKFRSECEVDLKVIQKFLNPPRLNFTNNSDVSLERASELFQSEIEGVQKKDCGRAIVCGSNDAGCGYGCQFHNRVGCLMLSYALGLPLIHDEESGRFYTHKWSDFYAPLGSKCEPNSNSLYWDWKAGVATNFFLVKCTNKFHPLLLRDLTLSEEGSMLIPYPLKYGIPVDRTLIHVLERNKVQDPFLWVVSQFVGYAYKLRPEFERGVIQRTLEDQGFMDKRPVVGLHVRRTDKVKEAPSSRHALTDYMNKATPFFNNNQPSSSSSPRTIFIASDDPHILQEALDLYPPPLWRILGFQSNLSVSLWTRRNAAPEIARDLALLATCDFVICGLSSNVCRLVLELQTFRRKGTVVSLDGEYNLHLGGPHKVPKTLIKVY